MKSLIEVLNESLTVNENYTPSSKAKKLYDNYLSEKKYAKEHKVKNEDEAYKLTDEKCDEIKKHYGKNVKGFVDQIDVAIETFNGIKNTKDEELWYNIFNY